MKRMLALALTFTFLLGMTACGQTQERPAASEDAGSLSSSRDG